MFGMFQLGLFATLCCVVAFTASREKRMSIADEIRGEFFGGYSNASSTNESDPLESELISVFEAVTPKDEDILIDMWKNIEIETLNDALKFLKSKSPSLHEKAEKVRKIIEKKVAALGPEANNFIKKVEKGIWYVRVVSQVAPYRSILQALQKFLKAFEALSPEAKADLENHFPFLTSFIQSLLE
ncbi:unnamed protein product [Nippostrongylus brasiliensis]|uniref:Fatty-acid and retinol-binding protein 1 n=1 Tax=Nippostrongylus brasiliensis TaxID=27835 RepID=A0A0N4Y1H7_NIPBR|nr:unnamed protein product [Nippostrongylus brasiliensis]